MLYREFVLKQLLHRYFPTIQSKKDSQIKKKIITFERNMKRYE